MASLQKQVLSAFKKLHQTRKLVFQGDEAALIASRKKINDAFVANKNVSDPGTVNNQIKLAKEVEEILRKNVIQAYQTDTGNFRVVFRKDIEFMDSSSTYTEMPEEMIGPFKGKKKCKDKKG